MTIPSKDWRDVYCVHSVSVYSDTTGREYSTVNYYEFSREHVGSKYQNSKCSYDSPTVPPPTNDFEENNRANMQRFT